MDRVGNPVGARGHKDEMARRAKGERRVDRVGIIVHPVTTSPYYRSGNTVGDIAEFRVVRRNAAGNTGVEHASWRQAILRNDRGMHAWRNCDDHREKAGRPEKDCHSEAFRLAVLLWTTGLFSMI